LYAFTTNIALPTQLLNSGDSYTDSGLVFCNPETAIVKSFGLLPGFRHNWVYHGTATYNTSLVFTYNYAYGGATIDAALVRPLLPIMMSLKDQVNKFLKTAATKSATIPWKSEDALFSVWIGINDIGRTYNLPGDRDVYVSFLSFSDLL
jgi:hypothetical protein